MVYLKSMWPGVMALMFLPLASVASLQGNHLQARVPQEDLAGLVGIAAVILSSIQAQPTAASSGSGNTAASVASQTSVASSTSDSTTPSTVPSSPPASSSSSPPETSSTPSSVPSTPPPTSSTPQPTSSTPQTTPTPTPTPSASQSTSDHTSSSPSTSSTSSATVQSSSSASKSKVVTSITIASTSTSYSAIVSSVVSTSNGVVMTVPSTIESAVLFVTSIVTDPTEISAATTNTGGPSVVVIGAALAGAVVLAVVGVLGWTFYVRHQRKRERDQEEIDDDAFMPTNLHHGGRADRTDTYIRSFVPVSEDVNGPDKVSPPDYSRQSMGNQATYPQGYPQNYKYTSPPPVAGPGGPQSGYGSGYQTGYTGPSQSTNVQGSGGNTSQGMPLSSGGQNPYQSYARGAYLSQPSAYPQGYSSGVGAGAGASYGQGIGSAVGRMVAPGYIGRGAREAPLEAPIAMEGLGNLRETEDEKTADEKPNEIED